MTAAGSIWKLNSDTASTGTPIWSPKWDLMTWGLTGTGKVGATVGDGSRDTMLDGVSNVHLTTLGHSFLGMAVTEGISDALLALAI